MDKEPNQQQATPVSAAYHMPGIAHLLRAWQSGIKRKSRVTLPDTAVDAAASAEPAIPSTSGVPANVAVSASLSDESAMPFNSGVPAMPFNSGVPANAVVSASLSAESTMPSTSGLPAMPAAITDTAPADALFAASIWSEDNIQALSAMDLKRGKRGHRWVNMRNWAASELDPRFAKETSTKIREKVKGVRTRDAKNAERSANASASKQRLEEPSEVGSGESVAGPSEAGLAMGAAAAQSIQARPSSEQQQQQLTPQQPGLVTTSSSQATSRKRSSTAMGESVAGPSEAGLAMGAAAQSTQARSSSEQQQQQLTPQQPGLVMTGSSQATSRKRSFTATSAKTATSTGPKTKTKKRIKRDVGFVCKSCHAGYKKSKKAKETCTGKAVNCTALSDGHRQAHIPYVPK